MKSLLRLLLLGSTGVIVACGGVATRSPTPPPASNDALRAAPAVLVAKGVGLPGANGNAQLDYIAYERGARRVWVPVGITGSVDVLDTVTSTFVRVDGFKTVEREARGEKRRAGPSAVSIGDGAAYVGNRGTNEVCVVDTKTLKLGSCLKLTGIDGISYVASAKEVWVTSPRDALLTVLDAATPTKLTIKTTIRLAGQPEGYAVDESRGLFFTNLEDKGDTVVIDVKTHTPRATWNAGCGSDGPRGVAADAAHGLVIVACTDHVQVLDGAHDGARLGMLDTGAGVDNIDFLAEKNLLYVAAGKAERLTVARVGERGTLEIVATGATSAGARNVVADESGKAYIADAPAARVLVFEAPPEAR